MTITYASKRNIKHWLDCLSNPALLVKYHPIILSATSNSDGSLKIIEKINLGSIQHTFSYPARISVDIFKNKITITAVVQKMVNIEMKFLISTTTSGTEVNETIKISSLLPVHRFMKYFLKKQHSLWFASIEQGEESN